MKLSFPHSLVQFAMFNLKPTVYEESNVWHKIALNNKNKWMSTQTLNYFTARMKKQTLHSTNSVGCVAQYTELLVVKTGQWTNQTGERIIQITTTSVRVL